MSTSYHAYAQSPPKGIGPSSQRGVNVQNNVQDEISTLDTTIYNYVLLSDIFEKYVISDTLADIHFLHQNSGLREGGQYINTANYGSAMQTMIFDPSIRTGFNTGYDQYKYYQTDLNNFRFYEQNRPLSDLYFSQLSTQENINVAAAFSRNFKNGLSLSLNYSRISQTGFYATQDTKSTSFGIGLRYQSPEKKYNAFLVFIHNANQESHIGGIVDETDLHQTFKQNIDVLLSDATTRQQERSLAFIQYYQLNRATSPKWNLYIKNDLVYRPSYFKFSDESIQDQNSTSFYQPWANDTRGIRRYLAVNQLSNVFYINGQSTTGI
ncbi:MAG: putative porin, partial [Saprospiraceae bacterium]